MPEVTIEELQKQISDLTETVKSLQKSIDDHDKTLLEHGEKHDAQEKLNKEVGKALKKAGTATPVAEAPPAPKKKEPIVTPKGAVKINDQEYFFTGPVAKDKKGNKVLTATIAESPDEYQDELTAWVENNSALLKKKV